MKYNKIQYIILTCMAALLAVSCNDDITEGYLNKDARYETNPFYVKQGQVKASPALATYGSTAPIEVKLLDIRNVATGETAEELLKTYKTNVWSGSYDPSTDTTFEAMVANKISQIELPILSVNEIGGRILLTGKTWDIEPAQYEIDVEVSNIAGSYVIEKACKIIIEPGINYLVGWREAFLTDENSPSGWIWRSLDYEVNHDPDGKNAIIIKWMDKNGTFFNPKKGEVVNGYKETWRHHFEENTPWGYELTEDAMVYQFPFAPFPGNGNVYSFRIPHQYIKSFSEPWMADVDRDFNTRIHNLNVYGEGTYTFIFKSNDIERQQ